MKKNIPLLDKEKEQHFLEDKETIELEVNEARINNKDNIIEIGAGDGRLTKHLIKNANKVLSFEIDNRFKENLDELVKEDKDKKLIMQYSNALDCSWKGYNKIVSNIPYSISGAILEKAIKEDIQEMILIVGENFKENLETREKIGIIARLFFDIKFIKKIDKKLFTPSPRVNSWLIHFTKKAIENEKLEDKILKDVLLSKRNVKNAIIYSFIKNGLTKNNARDFIEKSKFDKNSIEKNTANITGKMILRIEENLSKTPLQGIEP